MFCFILIVVCSICTAPGEAVTRYKTFPPAIVIATEGNTLRLRWTYELDGADEADFSRIELGDIDGGSYSVKYIQISSAGSFLQVLARFAGRLSWKGDTTNKIIDFELSPVNETDAGEFTCGIYLGGVKGYTTSTVILNVWVKPENLKVSETSLVREPGEMANITCTVTGKPTPSVTWNKKIGPGDSDLRNVTMPTAGYSNLVFSSLIKENGAEYVCLAKNPTMIAAKANFYLNVEYLTVEAEHLTICDVAAVAGQSKEICCPISGFPAPYYLWTRPNGTNVPGKCIKVEGSNDYGTHHCNASSGVGTKRARVVYGAIVKNATITWENMELRWTWEGHKDLAYYTVIGRKRNDPIPEDPYYLGTGISKSITIFRESLDRYTDENPLHLVMEIYATLRNAQTMLLGTKEIDIWKA